VKEVRKIPACDINIVEMEISDFEVVRYGRIQNINFKVRQVELSEVRKFKCHNLVPLQRSRFSTTEITMSRAMGATVDIQLCDRIWMR
jgi:hypothetical protein